MFIHVVRKYERGKKIYSSKEKRITTMCEDFFNYRRIIHELIIKFMNNRAICD